MMMSAISRASFKLLGLRQCGPISAITAFRHAIKIDGCQGSSPPFRDAALRLQKFRRHPALKGLLLLGLLENHAFLVAELDGPAARDVGPSERS